MTQLFQICNLELNCSGFVTQLPKLFTKLKTMSAGPRYAPRSWRLPGFLLPNRPDTNYL